jgi:hypothetical protein
VTAAKGLPADGLPGVSGEQLRAARDAVLAAVTGGHGAALEHLSAVPSGDLLTVAAVLALYAGRPDKIVLTVDEYHLARAVLDGPT